MAGLDRLLAQLNNTGLQQKDIGLYQVIKQLIQQLKELESSLGSSGSGSSSVINNINQINQFLSYEDSVNADDSEVSMGISGSGSSPSSGDDYVVLSDGVVVTPSPVDDGAGNFIYVAYTP